MAQAHYPQGTERVKPLTELLKKNAFGWLTQAEKSLTELKLAMTQATVLALPNSSRPFVVYCDALESGIGVVLLQESRPLAYFSKAIKGESQPSLPMRKK